MAITLTLSNHFKAERDRGNIDFDAHTFKIILMNTTFAFDEDAHATLADVSADELATENGYTQQNKQLSNIVVTEDDVNDISDVTWDDVSWTASGGSIGPTGAAIIYDETAADDTVVGCIDFGTDYTVTEGSTIQIQGMGLETA